MSEIPVGETITLEWPEMGHDASSDITWQEYLRSFDALEAQLVGWLTKPPDKPTGKPAPSGILTVHEGRVGGIPMCAE
jgi:hypothetical protein